MAEKDRVEELEEKVEELTEELERVKNRKTGAEMEKEVGEIQDQIQDAAEDSGISRRKFMKMIGSGAAGLSAAAVLPSVSGFTFKDDSSFKFGNTSSSQTNMELKTGGDLSMKGNSINSVKEVNADSINSNQVYDSQGRYLGTLTGENDAQVIIDAIADRGQNASIIVPNPGFDLEWEQQVDIPAKEDEFALETVGQPTLAIPSGFNGDYAIRKPPNSGSVARHYRIGSLHVDDGSNGVLTAGFHLSDIRRSRILSPTVENAPGIVLSAPNHYTQDNLFFNPYVYQYDGSGQDNNGIGIELTETSNPVTADQNWIVAPRFSDSKSLSETAFVDRGKHNMWLFPRVEFASRCLLVDGTQDQAAGKNYKVFVGNFDRTQDFNTTIEERGDAFGTIKGLQGRLSFAKLRLLSPGTDLDHIAAPPHSNRQIGAEDILRPLRKVTPARSLASMGLRDNSSGGSVSLGSSWHEHTQLTWSTGSTSGQTAVLDLGGSSAMKPAAYPKCSVHWDPNSVGTDDTNVVARMGMRNDNNNFAEIIHDPTDSLSGSTYGSIPTPGNYALRVVDSGAEVGTVDLEIGPAENNRLTLNLETDTNEDDYWFAAIDRTNTGTVQGGSSLGESNWRWYLETLEGADKVWRFFGSYGHSLWRM